MVVALFLLVVGAAAGFLAGRQRSGDSTYDTGPVVLAMQRIGDLHTASFMMNDVLHTSTRQEPSDGLAVIPGVSAVVHWATANRALVTATGRVEAGVDLTHLLPSDVTLSQDAQGNRIIHVHLPPISLYPADVHLHVVSEESGAFWRDENLIPKAEDEARTRFSAAAEQAGIRQTAQTNAITLLTQMEAAFGHKNIQFSF
jgi:hypothetical protein